MNVSKRPSSIVWLPRSRGRRLAFVGVYVLFLSGLTWAGLKLYWSARAGVPLNEAPQIWDVFYPEIRHSGVLSAELHLGDGFFDVLMLGASVIDPAYGTIEERLRTELRQQVGEKFRVFNLATSAHTTRDSLLKFRHLRDRHFDLVLVYHGINDIRMNNCRPGTFRADYSHCAWYRGFQKRIQAGSMSLPLTDQARAISDLIGLAEDQENLRHFGSDIKTPPAFRKNLKEIIEAARERREAVLLITFASFIPSDYSFENFSNGKLDYGFHDRSCPVEMWGEPKNVHKTLVAHNEVIRSLATSHSEVLFVDMEPAIPGSGEFFADVCHLTDSGCARYILALRPAIESAIATWRDRNGLTAGP